MIDKNFCMSSYLAFRYIERDDMEFAAGLHHTKDIPYPEEKKTIVYTADDIADAYKKAFESKKDINLGILLSGGVDSACLAAFMKPGTHAYTFRFLGGEFGNIDYERAEKYCQKYGLIHHAVDIDWNTVEKNIDKLMLTKGAPVHSIEP